MTTSARQTTPSEPNGRIEIQRLARGELVIESVVWTGLWITKLFVIVITTAGILAAIVNFGWPVLSGRLDGLRGAHPIGAALSGIIPGGFLFFTVLLAQTLFFFWRFVPVERARHTRAQHGSITTRAWLGRSRSIPRQNIDTIVLMPASVSPQGVFRVVALVREGDGPTELVPLTAPNERRDEAIEAVRALRVQLGEDAEADLELAEHPSDAGAFERRLKESAPRMLLVCLAIGVFGSAAISFL